MSTGTATIGWWSRGADDVADWTMFEGFEGFERRRVLVWLGADGVRELPEEADPAPEAEGDGAAPEA